MQAKSISDPDPSSCQLLIGSSASASTLCSPEEVELYHPNVSYAEKELEWLDAYVHMNHAKCYTSIDFVTETKIKEPVIFDMELAFIAGMGFEHIRAVKKVSDNLSLKEYEENSK